jgi:hypothetical protein
MAERTAFRLPINIEIAKSETQQLADLQKTSDHKNLVRIREELKRLIW